MPKSPSPPSNLAQQLLEQAGAMTAARMASILEDSLDPIPSGYLVPIDRIRPWDGQPRKHFDDAKITELAASMAASGLLQPLVVRRDPEAPGYFIVLAGHRRLLAARRAYGSKDPAERERMERLACIVREAADGEAFADALVENLVRDDLTRREVMDAIAQLKDTYGWSVREIARRTGRNASDVSILERIAHHPIAAQLVADERITPTAVGHLLRLPKDSQERGLDLVRAGRLRTVEQVQRFVDQARQPTLPPPVAPPQDEEERVISHTSADTRQIGTSMSQGLIPAAGAAQAPAAEGERIYVKAHTRNKGGAVQREVAEDDLSAELRSIVALVQDHALAAALGDTLILDDEVWAAIWLTQDEAVVRLRALVHPAT